MTLLVDPDTGAMRTYTGHGRGKRMHPIASAGTISNKSSKQKTEAKEMPKKSQSTQTETHKEKGSKKDNGTEQTFFSSTDGKRTKKSLANVYKILSANRVTNTYEFNSVNPMFQGGAFYILSGSLSQNFTTPSGCVYQAPIHMVDLTAVPNCNATTGALSSVIPRTQMFAATSASGANVSFGPAVETLPYGLQTSPQASYPNSYPQAGDQFLWSQIKLNLYGLAAYPLTYKIYFIKLKKDWLHPNPAVTGTTDEIAERNAFWECMAKPLTYNPILPQDSKHWKDVTVIKQDTFHIRPVAATNAGDTLPHVKTVEYFERWNMDCNYAWQDEGGVPLTATNNTQTSIGEIKTTVEPKKRVYMMIQAESFVPFTNQQNTSASGLFPTYDLMVKNKHSKIV